jgi:NADH-quinone oxidoreductase subunit C
MISDSIKQYPAFQALEANYPGAILDGHDERGELTLIVAADRIVDVCRSLKHQQGFVRLSSITAVDWHPADPRFDVVYHLHSVRPSKRLRLKCKVSEASPELDSVTAVWQSADWYEREIFDMFGIGFRNHPNLRRILMPEDWEGFPLRKDYPVHGYKYSYKDE